MDGDLPAREALEALSRVQPSSQAERERCATKPRSQFLIKPEDPNRN
jgi:hypothetical protein